MPIKRGEDGRILEEITQKPSRVNEGVTRRVDGKMPPLPSSKDKSASASTTNDRTVRLTGSKPDLESEIKKNVRTIDAEKTRVVRPKKAAIVKGGSVVEQVVGWLVIMDGPGKGSSREIGYGNNAIGRSDTAAISLPFGDEAISREKHCVLTYDPKSRAFFISPGESRNLVYLNDDPLLVPTRVNSDDKIGLGETILSFVAFCSDEFDWGDVD